MIVKKEARKLEVDELSCKIFDYDLSPLKIGLSYQKLNGRVPAVGSSKNKVCEEAYFILEGLAEIVVDGESSRVEQGDVVVLPVGSSSYVIAQNLKLITLTSPDWYASQHESA